MVNQVTESFAQTKNLLEKPVLNARCTLHLHVLALSHGAEFVLGVEEVFALYAMNHFVAFFVTS